MLKGKRHFEKKGDEGGRHMFAYYTVSLCATPIKKLTQALKEALRPISYS